ncbi:MAG: hypothetical protein IPJ16_08870 [Bacteroidales bacterium]|nr:hypothetical protein [Bacteroidales bacterium]
MKTIHTILFLVTLQFVVGQNITLAQDSIRIQTQVKQKFKADPLKATMMAVVFPGLGQIYNKKYWKVPIVYAGFASLIYSVGFNSAQYNQYLKALQDFSDKNPQTTSYLKLGKLKTIDPKTYDPVLYPDTYSPSQKAYYEEGMLRGVDGYKRYRDLSYIGIAGWYLLTILDANVDASLTNFDVSKNLDITFSPMRQLLPDGFTVTGLNMQLLVLF